MFHHGAFNPRFLGITLRFTSPATSQLFQDALTDDGAVDYEALDDDAIGIVGVLDHETKHYHDSLISPLASSIFWLRMSYFLNGLQALQTLKRLSGDAIFFSVKRWLKTPVPQRSRIAEALEFDDRRPRRFVDLPYLDPQGWDALEKEAVQSVGPATGFSQRRFLNHAAIALNAHDQLIATMADGPEGHRQISTRTIFEIGAYAVQIEAVRANANENLARRFVTALMDRDSGPGQLLLGVSSLWHNCVFAPQTTRVFDTKIANTVGTWALLGDIYREGRQAFPVPRLAALTEAWSADHRTAGAPDMRAANLWDLWDRCLGVTPWRTSLDSLVAGTDRRLKRYDAMSADLGDSAPHVATIGGIYAHDQREAVQELLRDPDGYCDPGSYVHGPWSLRCAPPAVIQKNVGFITLMAPPKDVTRVKHWGAARGSQIGVYRSLILFRDGMPPDTLDSFAFFDEIGRSIDLLMAGERVEDVEFAEVRALARDALGKDICRI